MSILELKKEVPNFDEIIEDHLKQQKERFKELVAKKVEERYKKYIQGGSIDFDDEHYFYNYDEGFYNGL
ncbi:MAG: hypothetical protein PHG05_02945 [Candidatus Nanoarchaeia archaeon]|nr:hypothetical protein [Candidatus Nanoarchaeia archaeon]